MENSQKKPIASTAQLLRKEWLRAELKDKVKALRPLQISPKSRDSPLSRPTTGTEGNYRSSKSAVESLTDRPPWGSSSSLKRKQERARLEEVAALRQSRLQLRSALGRSTASPFAGPLMGASLSSGSLCLRGRGSPSGRSSGGGVGVRSTSSVQQRQLVAPLTFKVQAGRGNNVLVTGPNGSGKSSLFRYVSRFGGWVGG